MKKDFSETLKELRIQAGFTQKQVYDMFNIRQSTFSAWETGRAEPSADMLLKLCKLYNVNDVLAAFGYDGYNEDGSIRLNMYEEDLVEKYRVLDTHGKEMVDLVLNKEYERSKSATAESNSDSEEKVYNIARAARGQQPLKMTEEQMKAFAESAKKAPNRSRDKDLF